MFVSHFQRSMETAAIQGLRVRFAHGPGYLIPRRWRSNLSFCAEPWEDFSFQPFVFRPEVTIHNCRWWVLTFLGSTVVGCN